MKKNFINTLFIGDSFKLQDGHKIIFSTLRASAAKKNVQNETKFLMEIIEGIKLQMEYKNIF